MIYVTSDLHFGHDKEFLWKPRGFDSIHEHDEAVIKRWNETVGWDDDVYILGDLMLNDNEHGMKCLRQLAGRKYVVYGNHDSDVRKELYYKGMILSLGYATMIRENGITFYLSHYPTLTSNYDVDKPLKARVVNLCGHTHTKDKWADADKGLIYHCELDAHDCRPVAIDAIIEDIRKRVGS